MGKRGPKPKSNLTALPERKEGPRPPEGMTPRARARWREIVRAYPPDRFKAGDLPLLRAYCEAHDLACRAEEELKKNGSDYTTSGMGTVKAHPAVAVKTAAVAQMVNTACRLKICQSASKDMPKGEGVPKPLTGRGGLLFGGKGA